MNSPILTVVMPVYNGEKHIIEAIESVINQTFKDFELIIINDGSLDTSVEKILSIKDKRLRFIDLPKNKGIAYCRNLGIEESRGEFLAWTDCDDLNLPTRFEKQISFLENNPEFDGCGTWLSRFNAGGTLYVTKAYENSEKIKAALLFQPGTIPNATAMLRLSEINKYNLWYDENFQISEDYDFIFKCSRHFKFTNIQEVLYRYRDSETSITNKFEDLDFETFNIIKQVYKKTLSTLDIVPTEKELRTHYDISSSKIFSEFSEFVACFNWLIKLKYANNSTNYYDKNALNHIVTERFFFLSKKASVFGLKTLYFFIKESTKNNLIIRPKNYLKLAVRCALKYDKFEFKLN
jgi:glycosyltransferase involved in cell wall biosynthesis